MQIKIELERGTDKRMLGPFDYIQVDGNSIGDDHDQTILMYDERTWITWDNGDAWDLITIVPA